MAWPAWDIDETNKIIASKKHLDGACIPILHALQDHYGYVDPRAVPLIADTLNLSKAEVHGVLSFYHDFRHDPPGSVIFKICRSEACQALGCENLVKHLGHAHGMAPGETSAKGVTVETVYCLGNCALGPAGLVNGKPIGRLNPEKLDHILHGTVSA